MNFLTLPIASLSHKLVNTYGCVNGYTFAILSLVCGLMLENSDDDENAYSDFDSETESDHVCFFFTLDAAAYNAFILFIEKHPTVMTKNVKIQRRLHPENMSMKLAENAIPERVQQWKNNNFRFLSRDLRAIATKYGYLEDSAMSAVSQRSVLSNSGRCFICPRTMDRKSKNICTHCKQFVCKDHLIVLCSSCDSRKA